MEGHDLPRRWLMWDEVADIFTGQEDLDWERDRDLIDGSIFDPWERSAHDQTPAPSALPDQGRAEENREHP